MFDKETDMPRYTIRLSLLGIIITCIIAFHLFINSFGELREMEGLGVLWLLMMSAPYALSYIIFAASTLRYFLKNIYHGVNRKKSIVYTAATLAVPFVVLVLSWDFLPLALGTSGNLFLWSALTVAILYPRKRKRKVRAD